MFYLWILKSYHLLTCCYVRTHMSRLKRTLWLCHSPSFAYITSLLGCSHAVFDLHLGAVCEQFMKVVYVWLLLLLALLKSLSREATVDRHFPGTFPHVFWCLGNVWSKTWGWTVIMEPVAAWSRWSFLVNFMVCGDSFFRELLVGF